MSRIETCFAELKKQNRAALVTFVTAGDPDYATAMRIFKGLPAAGADVIELVLSGLSADATVPEPASFIYTGNVTGRAA